MGVIRLLCLASLLALVVFRGTAGSSALADVSGVEEPPVAIDAAEVCAEDNNHQGSAGVAITMTGIGEEEEEEEEEEEDRPWARVDPVARTGSPG